MILMLLIPYLAALVFVACDLRGRFATSRIRTPLWPSWWWISAIVTSYAVQIALAWWAATHQEVIRVPSGLLPLPVLDTHVLHRNLVSIAVALIGALQTYALLGLFRAKPAPRAIAIGCAAMAVLSLGSPALASFDALGYVHDALLGRAAWAPPPVLPGQLHVVDLWFGRPMMSVYGPLWIPIVTIMTAAASGWLAKVLLLRAFGIAFLGALFVLLRALKMPARTLAIACVNPALFFEFVANAHNDVIPVLIVAAGAILMKRWQSAAAAAIVVAGSIKLPYVALGLPVLSAVRPQLARYAWCAAAVLVTIAISWFGGGAPYLHSLLDRNTRAQWDTWNLWHLPGVVVALALLARAVAGGRRYRSALWLMPILGSFSLPITFPWYFAWGFPYAFGQRRLLAHLLIGFPLAAALVTHELVSVWLLFFIYPLLVLVLCVPLQRRQVRPAPARNV